MLCPGRFILVESVGLVKVLKSTIQMHQKQSKKAVTHPAFALMVKKSLKNIASIFSKKSLEA